MKKNIHLNKGSIVFIPIAANEWRASVVIHPGDIFFIGVDTETRVNPDCFSNVILDFDLFAWTTDGEIYKKRWKLHNAQYYGELDFKLPNYKVMIDGIEKIEDFYGNVISEPVPSSDENIKYREIYGPIYVEEAVKANNGLIKWEPFYADMFTRTNKAGE